MRFLPDAVIEHMRAVADEPDLTGTKYRLVGRLGRGGMGGDPWRVNWADRFGTPHRAGRAEGIV